MRFNECDVRAWLVENGHDAQDARGLELERLTWNLSQDEIERLVRALRKAFSERVERALDEDTRAWLLAHGHGNARDANRWQLSLLTAKLSRSECEQLWSARQKAQSERRARGEP